MTDQRLTCAQINEEVALMLGWKQAVLEGTDVWFLPAKAGPQTDPPDSCGEWQHAGPLYVELLIKFNGVQFTNYGEDGWGCECFEVDDERGIDVLVIEEGGAIVEEAITRAFHAAFVEEKSNA